ncbi:MAG: hypothetical protein E7647_01920 [Ruminococcaceae bacterium]|nr:hypothetical protein [Oscillospiraceae bacterium]
MTKEKEMRLHRIFNIILAAFIVLTGLCFMAGCLRIYYNVTFETTELLFGIKLPLPTFYPDQEYSRAIVEETFGFIAVPVYATVALTVLGFVYEFISPINIKRKKMNKDNEFLAKRLRMKKNVENCDADPAILSGIKREQVARTVRKSIIAVLFAVFTILFLRYAAASSNYTDDINGSVINAFLVLLSCIVVPLAYMMYSNVANDKSLEKEIDLLKKLPDAREADIVKKEEKEPEQIVAVIRYVFIASAIVALLVAGIYLGGYEDVLTKAVNICTECIGLG